MSVSHAAEGAATGRGFFSVDIDTWAKACELGIDEAAALLVLARFSGYGNDTTAAGAKAITQYTGLGWRTAPELIARLKKAKLLRQTAGGSRPRYLIAGKSLELSNGQKKALDAVRDTGTLAGVSRRSREWLLSAKLIRDIGDGFYSVALPDNRAWLPNTLVSGAAGEVPPLELVRKTRDTRTLRLLVDLYWAQDLADLSGVPRDVFRGVYDRQLLKKQWGWSVWGFKLKHWQTHWASAAAIHRQDIGDGGKPGGAFFDRIERLRATGVIEVVPHVCESHALDAVVMYEITNVANELRDKALSLMTHSEREEVDSSQILVPVRSHVEQVALVGIARTTYRAHTERTRAWAQKTRAQAVEVLSSLTPAPARLAAGGERR